MYVIYGKGAEQTPAILLKKVSNTVVFLETFHFLRKTLYEVHQQIAAFVIVFFPLLI